MVWYFVHMLLLVADSNPLEGDESMGPGWG